MKLAQNTIEFMESHKMAKLVDIEKKEIKVDKLGKYIDKYGEVKIVFTIDGDTNHYYYMPSVMVKYFNDKAIEDLNNGKDTIKGIFTKKPTDKGRSMWTFEDID